MSHYHIHQHVDGAVIEDKEGGEYASLDEAIGDAAQSAREIMADRLKRGSKAQGLREFRIVDGQDTTVAVVSFDDVASGKPFPPPPRRR